MVYRLGLDVGTNSLGWSVLELDDDGSPFKISAAGVRIFADGREPKSKSTLQATRREARSARRRRDRYIQRRSKLLNQLIKHGLFPEDREVQLQLQNLNPLELRAKAVQDKEIPLHEFGRALFHLNQRRGFKSSRKDRSEETTSGMVANSKRKLLEQMELIGPALSKEEYSELSREERRDANKRESDNLKLALDKLNQEESLTFGSFLYELHKQGKPTRARPNSESGLYEVYPTREILEDEFHKMWKSQSRFHQSVLNEELRELFKEIIFFQRPLKPQPIGQCSYMPEEKRAYRAMPSFQRYRILQEVNSLEWWQYVNSKYRVRDYWSVRNAIVEKLEKPSRKEKPNDRNAKLSFTQIKKILKGLELVSDSTAITINFETAKRKDLDGNQTSNVMQHEDYVGEDWHKWPLEKQDEFISIILDETLEDNQVLSQLVEDFDLSEFRAKNCMEARLVDGTANISLKAAKILTKKMEESMLLQSDAVEQATQEIEGFNSPLQRFREGELLPKLPYYGKAVEGHIIPGRGNEEDEQTRIGRVSNPTVHIAMNQIRLVVNELIDRFGMPTSIAVELGRNLPVGKEGRSEIEREQRQRQQDNVAIDNILFEEGQKRNRNNRLLVSLWQEQNKICPFTSKNIGLSELFSGAVEIEHLIPFSKSLDDSRANKVLCTREANRDKGNRTPFEAFGDSPKHYVWKNILENVEKLTYSKQWRFQENASEIWLKSENDFSERHLNDTRYIGRLAKEYLENICPFQKIDVVTGRLTALLRHHWGLNSVLNSIDGSNPVSNEETKRKNRDDHRHHAVDAIVIGMTTRSMLQRVATEANRAEQELDLARLFKKSTNKSSPIDPWHGFRDEVTTTVSQIVVSHKSRSKSIRKGATDGQLHNETAYGLVSDDLADGPSDVVSRWPIEKFKTKKHLEGIRDKTLREEFLQAFETDGENGLKELAKSKGIRTLRCLELMSVIPIQNCNGKIYKTYKGDSNWGMEIFEHQGKWQGITISRFDANNAEFKPGSTFRPHPSARLVMRLQVNDCVAVDRGETRQIMRVQKLSRSFISLAPHYEANVDQRNRNKEDTFKYYNPRVNGLKSVNSIKIHVSPTGLVSLDSLIN